jgi:transposase InsO family protein
MGWRAAMGHVAPVDPEGVLAVTDSPLVASAEALFRYQVVSLVLAARARGISSLESIRQAALHRHRRLDGTLRGVSARTIRRWTRAFERRGLPGLEPASRSRTSTSVVLSARLLDFVRVQKQQDERASLPELLRRARETGVLDEKARADRTTLWRACRRQGLLVRRSRRARDRDSRRFAYPHRMQLVLCDGKHFRAGAARLRRVVLFFLDDATRLGLCAVVGTAEDAALFLRGLYRVVRQHGLMDGLYADHGCGFTANDSVAALAQMGVLLVHGEVAYPEGRGKVERFNRTADSQLLRHLDGRADVDPDCGALELRIQHFLERRYDLAPHESLDGLSPQARWEGDARPLRFPESDVALRRCFVIRETRRVSRDHVISFEGVAYEAPRGHAGTTVAVHRHLLDQTLSVMHDGRLVALHSVDLAVNARARRASPREQDETTAPLPPSAAELQWRRDFAPLTGPDGAFADTSDDEEIT